jgi:hypothetical protein
MHAYFVDESDEQLSEGIASVLSQLQLYCQVLYM